MRTSSVTACRTCPMTTSKLNKYVSPYFTNGELVTRLNHTVVRYKGRPVYVRVGGSDMPADFPPQMLSCVDLVNKEEYEVHPGDPSLDTAMYRVGYVNTNRGPVYLCRGSNRQYQQGLMTRSVTVRTVMGDVVAADNFIENKDLGLAILGDYPSWEKVHKKVVTPPEKWPGQAWCRDFAIAPIKGITVVYGKGASLGVYKEGKLTLRTMVADWPMIGELKQWMDIRV